MLLAAKAALATVRTFLSTVPWQVWAVLGALAAAWLWGNHQYSNGVKETDDKWEAAVVELQEEAEVAAEVATAKKEIRDAEFASDQTELQKEVDNAKTDDVAGPGVSAYFSRLRRQANSTSD
ncbi:MAG: hypothetical protein ABJC88_16985 [Parasphingorhabdus sp.]|uniref:hypothetical protein n=1 Tax=Sphingomonadales TaxID=204457 RepID=UPI00326555D3